MFLSEIWNSARDFVSNVYSTVKDRGSTLLTGSNYIGPWNRVDDEYRRKNPPVSDSDKAALEHDLEYERIAKLRDSGQINADEARRKIRESDKKVLDGFARGWSEHPWGSALGYLGISGKNWLEDKFGLDPNLFVTT